MTNATAGRAPAPPVRLADHTTFHLGGPAGEFVEAATEAALVEAVRRADRAGAPLFVLSGGSNVLVADAGFQGTVVHATARGVRVEADGDGVRLTVQAGEVWDDVVARAVAEGWSGLEALSGIPGLAGATPVQNVGAYGAEVAQTIVAVRAWDRHTGAVRAFGVAACGFGYRDSVFKRSREPDAATGRYVVLDVTFRLARDGRSAPIGYAELARDLGVALGGRAPLAEVRAAVLALRRSKGMVYDEADHDTWGAGSFFTNPVLRPDGAARLPEGAPRYAQPDGAVKTSAAWLIEHAGLGKGWGPLDGRPPRASLSTKHVLALTNRGSAGADDVVALARSVVLAVRQRFGIVLEPEPVLVGFAPGEFRIRADDGLD